MARPKKSNKTSRTAKVAANEVKNSGNGRFVWKENYAGFILGAIILVAIGILVANYFVKSTDTVSDIKTDISNVVEEPKTVTVERGESLSAIAARELGDANLWPEIVKENNLESTTVEVGQVLRIPMVSTPTASVTPEETVAEAPEEATVTESTTEPTEGEYLVNEGDTLWRIALTKYNDPSKWTEIAAANGVKYNSLGNPLIYTGTMIKLP